jgi:hypothetical protein
MACGYVTEREETLVAQALATSSVPESEPLKTLPYVLWLNGIVLTGAIVVGLEQGEEGADGEDVCILGHNHVGGISGSTTQGEMTFLKW